MPQTRRILVLCGVGLISMAFCAIQALGLRRAARALLSSSTSSYSSPFFVVKSSASDDDGAASYSTTTATQQDHGAEDEVKEKQQPVREDDNPYRLHWIAFTAFVTSDDNNDEPILRDEQMLALIYCRYMNPLAPIVLLLSADRPDAVVVDDHHNTLLDLLNIQRLVTFTNTATTTSSSSTTLRANYKHSSTNKYAFELQCVQRFLTLNEFTQSQARANKLRTIAHIDLDLVVQSPHEPIPVVDDDDDDDNGQQGRKGGREEVDIWALITTATYYIRFTTIGLADFCRYIENFYAAPPDRVFAAMQRYGAMSPGPQNQAKIGTAVRAWYNDTASTSLSSANNNKMTTVATAPVELKQFSDMYLLRAYFASTQHTNHLNVTILDSSSPLTTRTKFLLGIRQAFANPIKDDKSCRPPNGAVFQELQWRNDTTTTTTTSDQYHHRAYYRDEPLWGLHFQGVVCKRHMCAVLCPHIRPDHARLLPCCRGFFTEPPPPPDVLVAASAVSPLPA
jgi:hypothetical protein